MSVGATYELYRGRLESYFDGTARAAWEQLTSDAPVSGIRATVRAGRDRMRATLLDWLPADMRGLRLLDAGCGTGALAVDAARRGAHVVAIDVAGGLVEVAQRRAASVEPGRIDWRVGDMLDPALGSFDHVVAMDSLIHYPQAEMVAAIERLSSRTFGSLLVTFAPRTLPLTLMHSAGKFFPRSDRAPAIQPIAEPALLRAVGAGAKTRTGRTLRIASGFYTSQALEILPA